MDLRKPVFSLLVLLALLIGLFIIAGSSVLRNVLPHAPHGQEAVDERGVRIPPKAPPPRAEDFVANQNPRGFQLLVSYVNAGFEPREATIGSGDTIRFTNNSSSGLWIAADGAAGAVYPAKQNGCGSSALDSCRALSPGEYWEFTFTEKGTWSFVNNLDKSKAGVVRVTVQ